MGLYDRVVPVVAWGFVAAVMVGVPTYVSVRLLSGDPLYRATTTTATTTRFEMTGVLPDVWPVLVLWLVLVLLMPYAALHVGGSS